MRWPSAIMKHQLIQQTTRSIRSPHRHTSFPKDWLNVPLRGLSMKMYDNILLRRTKKWGSRARDSCLSLCPALSLEACYRSLAYWRVYTTGAGCVAWEDRCGSLRFCRNWVLAGQHMAVMSNACLSQSVPWNPKCLVALWQDFLWLVL